MQTNPKPLTPSSLVLCLATPVGHSSYGSSFLCMLPTVPLGRWCILPAPQLSPLVLATLPWLQGTLLSPNPHHCHTKITRISFELLRLLSALHASKIKLTWEWQDLLPLWAVSGPLETMTATASDLLVVLTKELRERICRQSWESRASWGSKMPLQSFYMGWFCGNSAMADLFSCPRGFFSFVLTGTSMRAFLGRHTFMGTQCLAKLKVFVSFCCASVHSDSPWKFGWKQTIIFMSLFVYFAALNFAK